MFISYPCIETSVLKKNLHIMKMIWLRRRYFYLWSVSKATETLPEFAGLPFLYDVDEAVVYIPFYTPADSYHMHLNPRMES